MVSPPALQSLHLRMSSASLPQLAHPMQQLARVKVSSPALMSLGRLTCALATRASSTMLPWQGQEATLPSAAASEGQGQLSSFHDLRVSSPLATGMGRGRASLPHPWHTWQMRGRVTPLILTPGDIFLIEDPAPDNSCFCQVDNKLTSTREMFQQQLSPLSAT